MNLIAQPDSRDIEWSRDVWKTPISKRNNTVITLTGSPALKVQVMCEGIRYTAALGAAAVHSMPNYYPYRFKEGEHDPTGKGHRDHPLPHQHDGRHRDPHPGQRRLAVARGRRPEARLPS